VLYPLPFYFPDALLFVLELVADVAEGVIQAQTSEFIAESHDISENKIKNLIFCRW
jgi:hypothetical protein